MKAEEIRDNLYTYDDNATVTGRLETEDGSFVDLKVVDILESKINHEIRIVLKEIEED